MPIAATPTTLSAAKRSIALQGGSIQHGSCHMQDMNFTCCCTSVVRFFSDVVHCEKRGPTSGTGMAAFLLWPLSVTCRGGGVSD